MSEVELYVDEECDERLDVYIATELNQYSRSFVQKLIKSGLVSIGGRVVSKSNHKLSEGDRILIELPAPQHTDILPEDIPLDILYEDPDLAIVNKPAGMTVHPSNGVCSGTLVNALLFHVKDLSSINGIVRPGIVHRLDKDTSGILVIAKNDLAHQSISEQLKARTVLKIYEAIVHGVPKIDSGTIVEPIGRSETDRKKMSVNYRNGKDAVTEYRVVERFSGYSRLELKILTGRTHQIRVHLAYLHFPIVGDSKYGSSKNPFGMKRQALHARTIGFRHPTSGLYMEFSTEPPSDYQAILSILRKTI